jgi:hypothetical protein
MVLMLFLPLLKINKYLETLNLSIAKVVSCSKNPKNILEYLQNCHHLMLNLFGILANEATSKISKENLLLLIMPQ